MNAGSGSCAGKVKALGAVDEIARMRLSSNQTKLLHQTMQLRTPDEDALTKAQAQVESQVAPVGALENSTLDGIMSVVAFHLFKGGS